MKIAVRVNGKSREVNLDGSIVNNEFKQASSFVRPNGNEKPVGSFKLQKPVITAADQHINKEEKTEVTDKKEKPVETKSINIKETINKKEEKPITRKAPKTPENKGMKLEIKKDGKTTEKVIYTKHEEPVKKHVNLERPSRRNPVQLTAITFEQMKELDFKYSSTDLEYHKMFFKADYGTSATVSVMVDFDSIPKDKLVLIADVEENGVTRDELDKALADLNAQEEALANLRKINDLNMEKIKKLEAENANIKETNGSNDKLYEDNINKLSLEKDVLESELAEAKKLLEEANAKIKELENKEVEEVVETEEVDNSEEDNSDVQGINFVKGLLMETKNIVDTSTLEEIPSDLVIVVGEDEYSELGADQNGNVLGISHLNGIRIDQLVINSKVNTENQGA